MKKIVAIIFFIALSGITYVNGQTMILTGAEENATVDFLGEIKLIDATVELNNATIKCKKIFISKTVKKISIKGGVNITCESIVLEADPGAVEIEFPDQNGNIQIGYSSEFKNNNRDFKLKATRKSTFNIIKM